MFRWGDLDRSALASTHAYGWKALLLHHKQQAIGV